MYLARVSVPARSPLVGTPAQEVVADVARDLEVDVLDVVRGEEHFIAVDSDRHVRAQDVLTVRGNPDRIRRLVDLADLRVLPRATVGDAELHGPEEGVLVELAVPAESSLVGETIRETRLRERYHATVLAVRRPGGELVREYIGDVELRAGDSLLVQTTDETAAYLAESSDFVVTGELLDDLIERVRDEGLAPTTLPAVGILLSVVALAAVDAVPIVIAALGGVVAMVVTGCVSSNEAYDAVNWNVVFLLAGVLPLGTAVEATGGAALLADAVVGSVAGFPPVVVLGAFYLLTGLLANLITPVATVVLLLPVAVSTAARIGADPFAFALAATFAASTAFMTPVGYQTNLMVYGPGGYRFSDYVRVGAPLQLLLAVVTTAGIALVWGVTPA